MNENLREEKTGNIYITRHGESQANIKKQIVGILDSPLTYNGINHAFDIGRSFNSSDVDIIVSSPLQRSLLSANIIGAYLNKPVVVIPDFRPQNFGVLEGLTLDEIKGIPEYQKYIHTEDTDKYNHYVEDGETVKNMEARIMPVFNKLVEFVKESGKNILIINHNSVMRCLNGNINGLSPNIWTNKDFDNGEIQIYNTESKKLTSGLSSKHHNELDINGLIEEYYRIAERDRLGLLSPSSEERDRRLSIKSMLSRIITYKIPGYEYIFEKFNEMELENLQEDGNAFDSTPDYKGITRYEASLYESVKNSEQLNIYLNKLLELLLPYSIGILHFGSMLYGKNFSVRNDSDIDIEVVFNKNNFDIEGAFNDSLFINNYDGNLKTDFQKFLDSGCDYFSIHFSDGTRNIDIRFIHNYSLEKISNSNIDKIEEYLTLKEFRITPRNSGLVKERHDLMGNTYERNNELKNIPQGQIIYYPLYKINEYGNIVTGNNIDKYCSYVDAYGNVSYLHELLHTTKLKVISRLKYEKKLNNSNNLSLINLSIRKKYFPEWLLNKISAEEELFSVLTY